MTPAKRRLPTSLTGLNRPNLGAGPPRQQAYTVVRRAWGRFWGAQWRGGFPSKDSSPAPAQARRARIDSGANRGATPHTLQQIRATGLAVGAGNTDQTKLVGRPVKKCGGGQPGRSDYVFDNDDRRGRRQVSRSLTRTQNRRCACIQRVGCESRAIGTGSRERQKQVAGTNAPRVVGNPRKRQFVGQVGFERHASTAQIRNQPGCRGRRVHGFTVARSGRTRTREGEFDALVHDDLDSGFGGLADDVSVSVDVDRAFATVHGPHG